MKYLNQAFFDRRFTTIIAFNIYDIMEPIVERLCDVKNPLELLLVVRRIFLTVIILHNQI